jgi:hypothetical protein
MYNYYTYAYLREDRTPYYIGRGKGRRAFQQSGHFVKVPPKDRILFLKTGLTYAESVRHEIYMIATLGRKINGTGCLRNYTEGGEGVPGYRHTLKTKTEMSRTRTGRLHRSESKERIRVGLANAWAEGRHHDMTGENNPNANGLPGERNGRSKLTNDDRRQIALEYVPGKKAGHNGNCAELAERYGVGMSQIRQIAKDPRWTS